VVASRGGAYDAAPREADARTGTGHTMNLLLWVLQGVTALVFGASGVMKVFLFERISGDVPSFGALPKKAWTALGLLELASTVGLIVPAALGWHPEVTVWAAAVLATETLLFIWVHVKYREVPPIVFSAVLGLVMAFIAYGRAVLSPFA
jgi:hypothetical protein